MKRYIPLFENVTNEEIEDFHKDTAYHDEALNIWEKWHKVYGEKYLPEDIKWESGYMIIPFRFPITMRQQLKEVVDDFKSVYGKNIDILNGRIVIGLYKNHQKYKNTILQ